MEGDDENEAGLIDAHRTWGPAGITNYALDRMLTHFPREPRESALRMRVGRGACRRSPADQACDASEARRQVRTPRPDVGRVVDRRAGVGDERPYPVGKADGVGLFVDRPVRRRVVGDLRVAEGAAHRVHVEGDITAAVPVGVLSQLLSALGYRGDHDLAPERVALDGRAVNGGRRARAPVVDQQQVALRRQRAQDELGATSCPRGGGTRSVLAEDQRVARRGRGVGVREHRETDGDLTAVWIRSVDRYLQRAAEPGGVVGAGRQWHRGRRREHRHGGPSE